MVAPAVSAEAPAPLAQAVVRGTNIFFHIGGADGVTLATLDVQIQIDGATFLQAVLAGVPQFPFDGSASVVAAQGDGFDVTLDYRGQLPKRGLIDVRVDAESTLSDVMPQVNYTFSIDNADLVGIQVVQIAQG